MQYWKRGEEGHGEGQSKAHKSVSLPLQWKNKVKMILRGIEKSSCRLRIIFAKNPLNILIIRVKYIYVHSAIEMRENE